MFVLVLGRVMVAMCILLRMGFLKVEPGQSMPCSFDLLCEGGVAGEILFFSDS